MHLQLFKSISRTFSCTSLRPFSTTRKNYDKYSCKLLVVGGGSGGCAVAAKFAKDNSLKKNELIIVDPSDYHYYQPLFTLVGGGSTTLEESRKEQSKVLPENATWIKDKASEYDVKNNAVRTEKGHEIKYDFLLIAVGLELKYEKIPGLVEALNIPGGEVCSNYSPEYVRRTYEILKKIESGNAVFTYPDSPVKCPGAPQKICYITDHYLRKHGKRNNVTIYYNTALPVIFGVKRYADALWKVCEAREIKVNLRTNLTAIDVAKKEATFENLDTKNKFSVNYSMLHVTPPMQTPESLKKNKDLTNEAGFVTVDPATLQHVKYPNVFSIGDCSSCPNSKTGAAVAAQSPVVYHNIKLIMEGKSPKWAYDGYASCPLVTGYDKCILAEFDYKLEPLETFPFRQDRELASMYMLKKHVMPHIYWNLMCNGYWNGPKMFRNIMHLNMVTKGGKLHL